MWCCGVHDSSRSICSCNIKCIYGSETLHLSHYLTAQTDTDLHLFIRQHRRTAKRCFCVNRQTCSSSRCASVCVEIIVCVYIRISSMSTFSPRGHPDSNNPVALLFKCVIFSRWGFFSRCVKNDSFVLQVLLSVWISACFVHLSGQKIDILGCILLFWSLKCYTYGP